MVSFNEQAYHFQRFWNLQKNKNKYFDRLVHKIREKFKAHLIDTKETIGVIHDNQKMAFWACMVLPAINHQKPQKPIIGENFSASEFLFIRVRK